eukprot:4587030-Alexandrium_andersonii.AAC.1
MRDVLPCRGLFQSLRAFLSPVLRVTGSYSHGQGLLRASALPVRRSRCLRRQAGGGAWPELRRGRGETTAARVRARARRADAV